ncbi:MAG: glutamate dehydrogenase, partial [Candidatus Neomarinimicrobiota bacterium]
LGIKTDGGTMAINGFGNAGQYGALLGEELVGLKLVAASDSRGGIYNPNGFSAQEAVDYKLKNGSLQGFPNTEAISNENLLELDVTVLFPAALEGVITNDNADRIKARIICELANGPTTPEADLIMKQNGLFVIPDFLANAGGVTVSYFEQVQNSYNFYWELDDVHRRLDAAMTKAFHDVYDQYTSRKGIHMRQAAYMISIMRVAEACRLRGWV